jgi:hypothetical protein
MAQKMHYGKSDSDGATAKEGGKPPEAAGTADESVTPEGSA